MKFIKYQYQINLAEVSLFLLFVFTYPLTANAYIDPGTGSIIIQAMIAGVAVVGIYFKIIWRKAVDIFRYFSSKSKKNQKDKENNTKASPIKSDEHTEQL